MSIIGIVLLTICIDTDSQIIQNADPVIKVVKAKCLKGDPKVLLSGRAVYPEAALSKNSQGDVIISTRINRDGKLDSLSVVNSPDLLLSASSILSLNLIADEWAPATRDNSPIDRKYLFVFRYRISQNGQLSDYKKRAGRNVERQKYEKALELYNLVIEDNPYDSDVYESRSKVREILGDHDGSADDHKIALRLDDEIMSLIEINRDILADKTPKPVPAPRVIRSAIIAVPAR